MKILIVLIALLSRMPQLNAQKVKLERDDYKHLCLNDSIAETAETKLKENNIDSIIAILYDYDNGRLQNSRRLIIWAHDGVSKIRIIEGCDKIRIDTLFEMNLNSLWQYIKSTHFDDMTIPIKSGTGQSHDKSYYLKITTPSKSFYIMVNDNERKASEKFKYPESDTRIMLTNKIDIIVNKLLQQ